MPVLAVGAVPPFLGQLTVLIGASVAIAYLSYRLRLVPIVGFLVAGVLIGPHALGLVSDGALVSQMAEVGVMLLLFTIGVEFNLDRLARLKRAILVGGGLQTLGTLALAAAVFAALGVAWREALFSGALVALSSTAIVLSILADRSETDTPTGQLALAILLFQDFAAIAFVLLVPLLGEGGGSLGGALWGLGRALVVVAVVVVAARKVVPPLLERVARTQRPELFLLAVVAVCLVAAFGMAAAGVSMALGAFVAGIVVSESPYSEQALADVMPFQTVFNAVFFVSVGMLLDVRILAERPLLIAAVVMSVLMLKTLVTGAAVRSLGYPVRIATASGLALAQIGEFAFVLEHAGGAVGLSPGGLEDGRQVFLAVSVLLMAFTPAFVAAGPRLGDRLGQTFLGRRDDAPAETGAAPELRQHAIVVGYGPTGQRLVRALEAVDLPYVIVELNPESAAQHRAEGRHVVYGDATRALILEHAGVERARLLVVTVNDPPAAARITALAHELNPALDLVVRARYLDEIDVLRKAGADIVVPEELEVSARVVSHVLAAFLVPPAVVEEQIMALRGDDYHVLRGSIQEAHLMVLQALDEVGMHTRAVLVQPGSPADGQTLQELALRPTYRLTVVAVRRGHDTVGSPPADFALAGGDRLILIGRFDDFAPVAPLLKAPRP